MNAKPRGRLRCVGLGMMLGAHLGARARACIESAEVVFVLASDSIVEQWLQELRPDARSLQPLYAVGKPRRTTYREMVEAVLAEVRAGRDVCAAFYGHPGVFARVAHDAIASARTDGHMAAMEPGVSAADCLYADLGIDPGRVGCQHYEATQLLLQRRVLDPCAFLVLWQVGLLGDRHGMRGGTTPAHLQLLVDLLATHWPGTHEVVLYEAATLPIHRVRMERVPLAALPSMPVHAHTTLVVPPASQARIHPYALRALRRVDHPRPALQLVHST